MKIEKKTHYLSIKAKRFWVLIGNVYGSGFRIANMYRCKKYQ